MGRHIPYFDFYPSDFMSGVRGLTPQEVGVYTMLLCRVYEENGPIGNSPVVLAAYCGMRPAAFQKVLDRLLVLGKFDTQEGRLMNRRAGDEISKRETKLNSSKKAGKASAEKRQQKQADEATGVERAFNHTDTDTDKSSVDTNVSTGAAAPLDPAKVMFDHGRALLTAAGKSSDQAGQLLGKWRKAHGAEAVITALGRAQREGAIDPVAFIEGCLKSAAKNKQADGEMFGAFGRLRELG